LKIPTISGTALIKKDVNSLSGLQGFSSRSPEDPIKVPGGNQTFTSLAFSPAKLYANQDLAALDQFNDNEIREHLVEYPMTVSQKAKKLPGNDYHTSKTPLRHKLNRTLARDNEY